jgi:Flp pilus assembly protein TadB
MGTTSGGNIPMLLCHAAEGMRRRRLQKGELRSKITEARATAVLLSLLPWGIGAFTFSQGPEQAQAVLSDTRGRLLLLIAFAAWLAGNVAVVSILRALLPTRRAVRSKGESA